MLGWSPAAWRAGLRWCMQDCGSGNCQRTVHVAGPAEVPAHGGDDIAGGTMATTTRPTKTGAAEGDGARGAPFASSWRRAHLTVDQRVARGRAARREALRSEHGRWEPAPDRTDPVDLLEEQGATRVPELVPIRYGRMLVSPFAFFRGAACVMASDLAGLRRTGLNVQLCGDAHLSNFGAYAAPDRQLVFSVNDFDETLPGPFEWDVKRLVASFAVAGRDRGFDAKTRAKINVAVSGAYREAMAAYAGMRNLDIWYDRIDIEQEA